MGETNFQSWEFPQNGSKAKDGERGGLNDGNNNGQLRIANATSGGACKAIWAKIIKTLTGLGLVQADATECWP